MPTTIYITWISTAVTYTLGPIWNRTAEKLIALTHWGWVTHICISNLTIIGSDNGLSLGRRQAQCMKRPVAHSLNSTWFWIELPENCCEPLKFIMKYISIQFCERPGHGRPFHALQAIIWISAGMLLIWSLRTNSNEISIKFQIFSIKKMRNGRHFVSASMC